MRRIVLGGVAALCCIPAAFGQSMVTVAVQFGTASELGPNPGVFRFERTGDLDDGLEVDFELSGSAAEGADYLVMDDKAVFAPGAREAYVAILPRNDSVPEPVEQVRLTALAGEGYTLGAADEGAVTIADAFLPGLGGVHDGHSGMTINPDLQYFDAAIEGSNLILAIAVAGGGTIGETVEVFLNTDQNSATGDWRPGHVRGQEFRVETAFGLFFAGYNLWKMPVTAPADLSNPQDDEAIRIGGPASISNGITYFTIPLADIGNPSAVDVFAVSHRGGAAASVYQGVGERLPRFGVLDTASRKVTVRHPIPTRVMITDDPVGDVTGAAFDVERAEFHAIADQILINIGYTGDFDPTNLTHFPGPQGGLILDGDRNVFTGGFPMGNEISTWGGEGVLEYSFAFGTPSFNYTPHSSGTSVPFGQASNDGRWLVSHFGGRSMLHLSASASMFDPVVPTTLSQTPLRTSANAFVVQMTTLNSLGRTGDAVPPVPQAIDTMTGTIRDPLAWEDGEIISMQDPNDGLAAVSGADLAQVDAAVIDGSLVVKGTLFTWVNTDVGDLLQIWIDSDMDAGTAPLGALAHPGGGPTIGADFKFAVQTADVLGGTAVLGFASEAGLTARADSAIIARPAFNLFEPGSFTVTIPLAALNATGPQVRLYLSAGNLDVDLLDVAPPAPLLVTVDPDAEVPPSITDHPASRTVTAGADVSFSAAATGSPDPALEWQQSADGGATWSALTDSLLVAGALTDTLQLFSVTLDMDGRWFRLRAFSPAGEAFSDPAELTVEPPPLPNLRAPGIAVSPADVEEGQTLTVTVTVANVGAGPAPASKLQVYLSPGNDFSLADDAAFGPLMDVPALAPGEDQEIEIAALMPNLGSGSYSYWVVAHVDAESSVVESDESDLWKRTSSLTAHDAPGPSPRDLFDAWANDAGLSGADAEPVAAPFGLPNLLKYAFNLDGSNADWTTLEPGAGAAGLPAVTVTSTSLRIEFIRRVGSGLSYTAESAPAPNGPDWTPIIAPADVTPIDPEWERAVFEIPLSASRLFVRVRVELP